jgi:hypothetical protein
MTTRNDRTRRKARKLRKRTEAVTREKAADELRANPTRVNHSRLLQVFATMSFRSHEKGGTKPFKDHVFGPTVTASTPEELVERTDEAHVDETLREPEN